MAIGVFIFDIAPPCGTMEPVLYVGVVLVSLLAMNRTFTLIVATICTVLTVVVFFISSADALPLAVLENRVLAIFTILVTALIGVQLERSQERVKAVGENAEQILRASPVGMLLVNGDGRITMANRAVEELFGYNQSELLAMTVEDLVPSKDRDGHIGHRDRFLNARVGPKMGVRMELNGLHRDGTVIPLENEFNLLTEEDEKMILVTVIDIRERKRMEDQKRVGEEERRMVEDLKRSNRDLDDFAYIASHDLKEPLRGINNYAIILGEDHGDRLDDDGQAKLETISRLCRRMENLINSLLEYSRVGRAELAFMAKDLEEVVDKVIDSIHVTLEEQGVEIRRPQRLPVVRCDGVLATEIFHNLLVNALKYNDKAEKWIEIGYSKPGEEGTGAFPLKKGGGVLAGEGIVFHVRDNGIGICEKHLDSIFGIFKRLHGRGKYGGGTGAGLTIVKKIVERHGGRIWVESTYGEGSTFYFTLGQCQDTQLRGGMEI